MCFLSAIRVFLQGLVHLIPKHKVPFCICITQREHKSWSRRASDWFQGSHEVTSVLMLFGLMLIDFHQEVSHLRVNNVIKSIKKVI